LIIKAPYKKQGISPAFRGGFAKYYLTPLTGFACYIQLFSPSPVKQWQSFDVPGRYRSFFLIETLISGDRPGKFLMLSHLDIKELQNRYKMV
jgi:hypothetical protein